jgi:hypothetical protein
MRQTFWTVLIAGAALVALSAQAPAELQIVNDAAQALGGKDRVQAVKTIAIEGEGSSWGAVGGPSPLGAQNLTKVTEYRQLIDVARERMRVTSTRTLQFPFASGHRHASGSAAGWRHRVQCRGRSWRRQCGDSRERCRMEAAPA